MAKESKAHNEQYCQDPEDHHDSKYDNDVPVDSWLRSNGEKKPAFDKGSKGR